MTHSTVDKIFVVGTPRSGTGYLSKTIALMTGSGYVGETGLFYLVGARKAIRYYQLHMKPHHIFPYSRMKYQCLSALDTLRMKDRIYHSVEHMVLMSKITEFDLKPRNTLYKSYDIKLSPVELKFVDSTARTIKKTLQQNGFPEMVQQYFTIFRKLRECRCVVEKTPLHIKYLPVIHQVCPNSKIVMIVRDKRDSIASYLTTFHHKKRMSHLNLNFTGRKQWIVNVTRMFIQDIVIEKWAENQDWIKKVNYSDFVEQPEETIIVISEWLEKDC